jgi:hypothetical protein
MNHEAKRTALDRFGELLVKSLRDKAIEQNEMLLAGQLRGKAVQPLQARVGALSEDQKDVIRDVVNDLLNVALHDFLFALQDAHDRNLGIEVVVDGSNIAELSGMLHGEALGPDGWIDRFSKILPRPLSR